MIGAFLCKQASAKSGKITDLILSDIMITPEMWPGIEEVGKRLGLRNIILVHSHLGGPCTGPAELVFNEYNYHMLKRIPGTVFMGDLLKKYASEIRNLNHCVSFFAWYS